MMSKCFYLITDGGNIADNSNTLVVEEEGEAGGLEGNVFEGGGELKISSSYNIWVE